MSDFGDADPEDAYDVGDPPGVRYVVILLWLASIALEAARAHDHVRVLARIQSARWAAGLLAAEKRALPRRARHRLTEVQAWLDDLLAAEGP